jgi:hypothetical protein
MESPGKNTPHGAGCQKTASIICENLNLSLQ